MPATHPRTFNVHADLLAAAIAALGDCAQARNPDNAATGAPTCPLPADGRPRCARHAKTWPSALATSAITTSSGRSGDGRLTIGRPIITAALRAQPW